MLNDCRIEDDIEKEVMPQLQQLFEAMDDASLKRVEQMINFEVVKRKMLEID